MFCGPSQGVGKAGRVMGSDGAGWRGTARRTLTPEYED